MTKLGWKGYRARGRSLVWSVHGDYMMLTGVVQRAVASLMLTRSPAGLCKAECVRDSRSVNLARVFLPRYLIRQKGGCGDFLWVQCAAKGRR